MTLVAVLPVLAAPSAPAAPNSLPDSTQRYATASAYCGMRLLPPVEGGRVLTRFRAPATPWSSGHRGIDLAVGENRILVAPADGRVSFVGSVGGKSVVSIDHGGYVSSLEPAADAPLVGTAVRAGERVAVAVGGSDHCGDSCVHWGVRTTSGEYVDPSSLIGSGVVLKPLEG